MFYRAKLLLCFHSLIFFSINIIYSIYIYQNLSGPTTSSEVRSRFYTYLLFIVMIMFINMWEILKYWIDSRKKEFTMRRVVGATRGNIICIFILDYLIIILASILIGLVACFLFSFLPLEYSHFILKSFDDIWGILILSYALPMLVGILMLWRQQKIDGLE